ncbi:hypothetical protein GMA11_07210 [Granulicatella sp. zg-ZJ]|uniref:hypothetical protein n=1 Tax=Granulicatella sp. zg-ZJ TaxID=2678504 RepID=UPI0013D5385A|nr:hypothetical protein [Granulicatella sp. zg-ZJ]NEW63180.1 hypothetical protein [Granulicatella sp. zg-ZJ]
MIIHLQSFSTCKGARARVYQNGYRCGTFQQKNGDYLTVEKIDTKKEVRLEIDYFYQHPLIFLVIWLFCIVLSILFQDIVILPVKTVQFTFLPHQTDVSELVYNDSLHKVTGVNVKEVSQKYFYKKRYICFVIGIVLIILFLCCLFGKF